MIEYKSPNQDIPSLSTRMISVQSPLHLSDDTMSNLALYWEEMAAWGHCTSHKNIMTPYLVV